MSSKLNKRLMRYCTFVFSLCCRSASVTSYLSAIESENLQNGNIHPAQIPDFEQDSSRTIWRIVVSDGSFFFSFFTFLHLSITFFDRSFPLSTLENKRTASKTNKFIIPSLPGMQREVHQQRSIQSCII